MHHLLAPIKVVEYLLRLRAHNRIIPEADSTMYTSQNLHNSDIIYLDFDDI